MSVANRWVRGTAVAVACCLGVACIGFRGPADIKRGVERRTATDLDREFAITIGPASMALVRWVARASDEPDAAPLRSLRKIQVGVYHRDDNDRGRRLDRHLEPADFPEFDPMVIVRDEDERVLVLAESRDGRLRRMVVVVDDLEEVVIVRLKGDLDAMIEQAIRIGLDEADHGELADPTVEAYREQGGDPDA